MAMIVSRHNDSPKANMNTSRVLPQRLWLLHYAYKALHCLATPYDVGCQPKMGFVLAFLLPEQIVEQPEEHQIPAM
jgi:hypothetical protein